MSFCPFSISSLAGWWWLTCAQDSGPLLWCSVFRVYDRGWGTQCERWCSSFFPQMAVTSGLSPKNVGFMNVWWTFWCFLAMVNVLQFLNYFSGNVQKESIRPSSPRISGNSEENMFFQFGKGLARSPDMLWNFDNNWRDFERNIISKHVCKLWKGDK